MYGWHRHGLLSTCLALLQADAQPPQSCGEFCTRVVKRCTGEDSAYDTIKVCRSRCSKWKLGVPGDIVGNNTFHCRAFWLDYAESPAGKKQRGVCDYAAEGGGLCDASVEHSCGAYCDAMSRKGDCGKGPWNPTNRNSCISACRMWPAGTTDDLVGNTLACRLHYVNAAEQSLVRGAKKLFCPSAALDGGGACTSASIAPNCTGLCAKLEQICRPGRDTGIENSIFTTTPDCINACEELQPDTAPSLSGPTIGCIAKYVAVATRCTAPAVPCNLMSRQCFSATAAAARSEL